MSVEQRSGPTQVELSTREFNTQLNIARGVVNGVCKTALPLLTLGYTPPQVRVLQQLNFASQSREPNNSTINNRRAPTPCFANSANFDSALGTTVFSFPGNGDFVFEGSLEYRSIVEENFDPQEQHPYLYLIKNGSGFELSLDEVGRRINFLHMEKGMMGDISRLLNSGGSPKWENEEDKRDIVFPRRLSQGWVVRKIFEDGEYEVWGRKPNKKDEVMKKTRRLWSRSPVFSPVAA